MFSGWRNRADRGGGGSCRAECDGGAEGRACDAADESELAHGDGNDRAVCGLTGFPRASKSVRTSAGLWGITAILQMSAPASSIFQTTCDVRFGGRLVEIVVAHQDGGVVRLGGSNRLADFALAGGKFDVDDVDDA